jgi:hypothetical protein
MAIPEKMIEEFFMVFYDLTEFTSETMRADISAGLEAAGVADLIEALKLVEGSLLFDREEPTNKEVMRRLRAALAEIGATP